MAVLVAEALRAAGMRVGLYTSPHLVDVRERMLVDGCPISRDAFAAWTNRLRDAIGKHGASFFDATTAIAFADAAARGADIAVVEVGLGGRLDSTNVIDPLVSTVTNVSLEHTEYLGTNLRGIAREKAGIAKPGRPFVIGETVPELADEMEQVAAAAGALPARVLSTDRYVGKLSLKGAHQRRNAVVALAVLEALPEAYRPSASAIRVGFARAVIPGRFDRRGKWIMDVAHNPPGIAALLATLAEVAPPRPIHGLVAILRDKAWPDMLGSLRGALDRIWLTQAPTAPAERRWDLAEVASVAAPDVTIEPDFDAALSAAEKEAGTVLVCGSFHTVGDAMARLPGFRPVG